MASLLTQIKVRKDVYGNDSSGMKNLVLAQGEPGFAYDTGDFAIGDGTKKFSEICFSLKDGVTSNGTSIDNAIARFDGTTGRIIQTSGATIDDNRNLKFNGPGNISWEDGSYFQRIQVTDDSTQNTAVFTFQQTENSGTAWNDLFTIQDRGTIIAKNSTGGALSLTLDRGSNANWRWLSDNGNFIAQCDYTTAKGSYFNVLTMNYNTGHISVDRGSLTSKGGFIHGNLTVPSGKTKDDYVLLAGGGSKALSDMTYSLPLATSTIRGGLKVGFTSTENNLALNLSTATASAEQAYVSLPSRLYAGNTTATTNPTHSGYYFYKDESDAGKVFNDTAASRQAATWVSAYDGSWAAQIGVGYYKDVIAYRRKQGSTTWGSWIELADKQWVKDQGYLTAIPSRIGPNTNGNNVAPNNNHTSGWAYYSNNTPGANGLPANVQDAEYLTLGYNNSTWAHQLLFKFNGGGTTGTAYDGKDLYTRIYNQNTNSWSDWYTILTSGNATSILNDKYVTIDTAQDITGAKTYKAPIKTTAECLGNESSNLQFVVGIKAFASGGDMLWQNASDLVWNNIPKKNLTGATHSGWTNQETDAKLIPTMNMIAYWNGAYNSSNSSNLKYSTNGEIVGGSGLTADKIVVGNGGAKVKTSSKGIVSSITATDDSNLPTSKAVAEYVAGYSDGHYSTTSGIPAANNGYLKITINSRTSWMLAFTVRTYQAYTFTDYHISGYNYSTTSPYTWYSPEAFLISEKSGDQKVVYFGHQNEPTTAGYRTLWVAIPAGDYAGVDIIDVTNGYTQIDKNGLFTIEYIALGSSKDTSKLGGALTHTVTARRQAFVDEIIGDTTYGADRGISLVSGKFGHSNTAITAQATKGLYKFSYDAYGHITGAESYTDQNTTYSFTSGTDGFIVTPSGGSAQTVSVTPRRISSPDTRYTAIGPDGISAGIQFDFKTGATVNHPTTAGGKYVGVMTWKSYGGTTDYSGGGPLQLSYDEAGVLWTRLGSRAAWGNWHQLATIEDVTSISGAYLPLAGGTMNENAVITLPNTARIVHQTKTSSNYVADAVWYKGTGAASSGYDAQIGWHNTGDTDGAITILPYATTSEPWSSNVGLYISKTRLKYNGTNISLEGHGHTDMVTGSGLTANNIVVGNNNSAVKISTASVNSSGQVIAEGFGGDATITIKPHASNEINFGGTSTSTTIYFGHQAVGSRPKPTHYQFGGTAGDATVQASGFKKTGSDDTYVLLAGGGHKALSDFTTGGGAIGDYVTLTTPQTISGAKTFSAQPVVSTADGLKFTNGNCSLRIYNTSASPTDYSAIEVRSNAATTNRNLFIDLANNSLVVGTPSGTADTTYKVKIVGTLGVTGQLTSTVATGTAPLAISSTTKVTNLNADKVDGCDVVTSTATFPTDSDVTVPTSKAVASYVSAQKTSGVYWADQSIATSSSINTEPTFKSVTFSDGATTKKASWQYNSSTDCVELVWA